MAKKITKKSNINKLSFSVHPLTFALLMSLVVGLVGGVAYLFGVNAAPSLPTGTIAINSSSTLQYGGNLIIDTSYAGKLNPKAYLYVSTVCWDANTVVYQASKHVYTKTTGNTPQVSFQLLDQQGQGLEWAGQAATCDAWLVYRIDGQNTTIEPIAKTGEFSVSAAQ